MRKQSDTDRIERIIPQSDLVTRKQEKERKRERERGRAKEVRF